MRHRDARHAIWLLVSVWSTAYASDALAQSVATKEVALESATWTKIPAPPIATARAANVFVYDETRENCVVFGGRPVDDHGTSLDDTGIWSGDTWVPVAAEYGHRGDVTGAFDSQRQRIVVYGGTDGLSFFGDTWEFDGSGWTRRVVASPGNRRGNGLAYDSRRQLTVLFGGYNGVSWKDELWEWDGSTWTHGCVAEPCSVAPRPAARSNAVFVYDDARDVSLLFGGSRDGQSYDDTWSWDGERWQELHPVHVPLARDSAAATYDPVSKRVLLFGGLAVGRQELNDLWAWDGRDWAPISQTSAPFARHGAGMAWHAKDRHGILFGGSAGGKETDAWELQLFGTPCTTTDDCHIGRCVQGSCPTDPDWTSSGEGGNSSGGDSAGNASGGLSGGSAVDGGSSEGGKQVNPGGGAVGNAGRSPAGNGGTAADVGGAGAAEPVTSSARNAPPPARSFYSCALSAPSRRTPATPASSAVLAVFATWLSRRLRRPADYGTPHHNEEAACANANSCADNHDVLTGSDSNGKACTATTCAGIGGMGGGTITDWTCQDWTLGTSMAGIAPRCGHTWPSMTGSSDDWISRLTENGCAPGFNLVQNGGPMPTGNGSVGDGGGYGAIYCLALSE